MGWCGCWGWAAGNGQESVTGPAAGSGEGRSASAPAKRGVREMVHCGPIELPWRLRVETVWAKASVASCAGLLELVLWLGVEVVYY